MNKIISFLKNKGIFTTLFGIGLAIACDYKLIKAYYGNTELSEKQLYASIVINIIAIVWVILPSRIKVSGKLMSIDIED